MDETAAAAEARNRPLPEGLIHLPLCVAGSPASSSALHAAEAGLSASGSSQPHRSRRARVPQPGLSTPVRRPVWRYAQDGQPAGIAPFLKLASANGPAWSLDYSEQHQPCERQREARSSPHAPSGMRAEGRFSRLAGNGGACRSVWTRYPLARRTGRGLFTAACSTIGGHVNLWHMRRSGPCRRRLAGRHQTHQRAPLSRGAGGGASTPRPPIRPRPSCLGRTPITEHAVPG